MSQAPHRLPPYVYEFWPDPRTGKRCLYVGKATGGPGMRIKAHYDNRTPWALEARWIRVTPLPPGTPDSVVLAVEAARIRELEPRGNQEHNWAHYDRRWALQVQRRHARAMGAKLPAAETWALAKAWAADVVRRVARFLAWWVGLNVVVWVLWHLVLTN